VDGIELPVVVESKELGRVVVITESKDLAAGRNGKAVDVSIG
jgi:hypothetical protein